MPTNNLNRGINAKIEHVKESTIIVAGGNVINTPPSGARVELENDATTGERSPLPTQGQQSVGDPLQYDVFVSYSHIDQAWVWQWLLPRLQQADIKVCIDRDCFEPGAPIISEIERATMVSRKTLLILTPAYLESEWAELENLLAATQDPAARNHRLLPVMLEKCALPLRLRSLIYLDFTDPGKAESHLNRLLSALLARQETERNVDEERRVTEIFRPDDREDECASLRRQRANGQIALRLIEQRMSEYVEATAIPLDLVKRKRQVEARINELTEQIIAQCAQNDASPPEDERCSAWRQQLTVHQKNLQRLELQKAQYGSPDVPLRILNQMDEERAEINRLETLLRHGG